MARSHSREPAKGPSQRALRAGELVRHALAEILARGGNAVGNSAPREMHAAAMGWPLVQTGKPAADDDNTLRRNVHITFLNSHPIG